MNFSAIRRWDKFEESYRVMQFSNGDRCWNGPDRSLKVCISYVFPFCLQVVNSNPFYYLHLCRLGLDVGWVMSLMMSMSLADASMWICTDSVSILQIHTTPSYYTPITVADMWLYCQLLHFASRRSWRFSHFFHKCLNIPFCTETWSL